MKGFDRHQSFFNIARNAFNQTTNVSENGFNSFNFLANGGGFMPDNELDLAGKGFSIRSLFDTSFNVGLDTVETWDVVVNDALVPASRNTSITDGGTTIGPATVSLGRLSMSTDCTVGADDTIRWLIQSRQNLKFRPSDQTIVFINGVFADSDNSVVNTYSIRAFSGFQEDIPQASWNVDSMDGTGPSGITIDFNKVQTLVIHSFYKSAGALKIGFLIEDTIYYVHEFAGTNSDGVNPQVAPARNLDVPIRMELLKNTQDSLEARYGVFEHKNAGVALAVKADTSATNPTVNYDFFSAAAFTLGQSNESSYPFSAGTKGTFKNVTVPQTPIVSIRAREFYFSEVNKVVSKLSSIILNSNNADLDKGYIVEVIFNGVLVGDSFSEVDILNSTMEVDTTATSITGGIVKRTYGSFPNSSRQIVFTEEDLSNFIKRIFHTDITYTFAVEHNVSRSDTITFAATAVGADANVGIDINWDEVV